MMARDSEMLIIIHLLMNTKLKRDFNMAVILSPVYSVQYTLKVSNSMHPVLTCTRFTQCRLADLTILRCYLIILLHFPYWFLT
jgi:hypothetical protein